MIGKVSGVENDTTSKLYNTAAAGIIGCEAAKLVRYRLFPEFDQFAYTCLRKGKDYYIREAAACAQETINNLKGVSKAKIDINTVCKNAESMYPQVAEAGKKVASSVRKTGLIAGAAVAGVAALYNFVVKPYIQAKKEQKQVNQDYLKYPTLTPVPGAKIK